MANYVYNNIAIVAKSSTMLDILNEALVNSDLPKSDNIDDAFTTLRKQGKHRASEFSLDTLDQRNEVKMMDGVYFSTFRPIPNTFLEYDTVNRPQVHQEAANEQKEKYGVVGWYDYNTKTFGCKWDCALTDMALSHGDTNYVLTFQCETPWSAPIPFCEWLVETFGCNVLLCALEESVSFAFCHDFGNDVTHDYEDLFNALYDNETDDEDAIEIYENAHEQMIGAWYDLINEQV